MGESQASSQRKRPAAQHEHEHEFAGDEQPTKRIMLSSTTQVQEVENSILACPMYKYDPVMYRQCAKYLAGGSTTLNRIRQHLKKSHKQPNYCPRCHTIFTFHEFQNHTWMSSSCWPDTRPGPSEPPGLDSHQMGRLNTQTRASAKKTPSENWYTMYELLFPNAARPESPYVTVPRPQGLLEFERFVHDERASDPMLLEIIEDSLYGHNLYDFNSLRPELANYLRCLVPRIVRRFVDRALISSERVHNQPETNSIRSSYEQFHSVSCESDDADVLEENAGESGTHHEQPLSSASQGPIQPSSTSPLSLAHEDNVSNSTSTDLLEVADMASVHDSIYDLDATEIPPSNETQTTHNPGGTYHCKLCSKSFTRAFSLRSHERTHLAERPFVCNTFEEAFSRPHVLSKHEQLHTRDKEWVCMGIFKNGDNWGCYKRFLKPEGLGRHFKSEQGMQCIAPLIMEEASEKGWELGMGSDIQALSEYTLYSMVVGSSGFCGKPRGLATGSDEPDVLDESETETEAEPVSHEPPLISEAQSSVQVPNSPLSFYYKPQLVSGIAFEDELTDAQRSVMLQLTRQGYIVHLVKLSPSRIILGTLMFGDDEEIVPIIGCRDEPTLEQRSVLRDLERQGYAVHLEKPNHAGSKYKYP